MLTSLKSDSFAQIKSADKLYYFFSSLKVSLICYEDDEMTLDDKSDLSDILNEYLDKFQKFGFGYDTVQEKSIKEEKEEKKKEAEKKTDEKKKEKKKSKSEKSEKQKKKDLLSPVEFNSSLHHL